MRSVVLQHCYKSIILLVVIAITESLAYLFTEAKPTKQETHAEDKQEVGKNRS